MGGFNIGIGVGLRYPAPQSGKMSVEPPEPDITDALLMEDGTPFLMEDGTYFQLEGEQPQGINRSYWNF